MRWVSIWGLVVRSFEGMILLAASPLERLSESGWNDMYVWRGSFEERETFSIHQEAILR